MTKVVKINCISMVVVNYNAGPMLANCIESAISQVGEILVVDNASSDTSFDECVKQFDDHTQITFIRNEKNLGFAAACNIGIGHSNGDVILFLNPDCQLDKGSVSQLCQVLMTKSQNGMVGGLLMNPDGTEQGGGRRSVPTPWRSFVRAFGLYRFANRWPKLFYDFHLNKMPLPDLPIEVEAISGACMLVKREAVDDVGLWDEGYFLHCEDLDWCMRFREKKWKILFVPSARITHVLGFCSRSRPVFVEWHKHKGMVRFYRKYFRHQYPLGLMGLVILGVWLRFIVVACLKVTRSARGNIKE